MKAQSRKRTAAVAPSPLVIPPSQSWEGSDGAWSTFPIGVGTPPQIFRVLISTSGQNTLMPLPGGCLASDPPDCASLRGIQNLQNSSSGFKVNESSTWNSIGLYTLGLDNNLNYTGNGEYGFDSVGLHGPGNISPILVHQIVAGFVTKDYMLGVFGLSPELTNFADFNATQAGSLWSLRDQNLVPSLSYGYSAGAAYMGKIGFASLVLGGYDASRLETNNLTISFGPDDSRRLYIGLHSIQVERSLLETVSLLPNGISATIDSTVPEIWLPISACQAFEAAFGLQFDNHTDRYLVNDTVHSELLRLNPSITLKLGEGVNSSSNVNIVLPYAAFDLQAQYPIYTNTTNYFPLRRATKESQYTIGRTFLQEAYIMVDYERSSFTIAQAVFPENATQQIIPVLPLPEAKPSAPFPKKSQLIGIIMGCIGLLLLFVGSLLGVKWHRKRTKQETNLSQRHSETKDHVTSTAEDTIHETDGREHVNEIDNGIILEMDGKGVTAEIQGVENIVEME